MKIKTINKILGSKFDKFVSSIKDEKVRELVKNNTIITGGCITSMLLDEEVSDYDLYFRDAETTKAVAEYYVALFCKNTNNKKNKGHDTPVEVVDEDGRIYVRIKSAGVVSEESLDQTYEYFETKDPGSPEQEKFIDSALMYVKNTKVNRKIKYQPVFFTANSITLTNQIQLITRFYGSPEDIHKNYDFVHCTNYWTSWDRIVVTNEKALLSILSRELIYTGSLYPICSIIRTRKFIKRGWTVNAGQYLKMIFQCNELNLKDVHVLRDQLIGVDVAYFHELIRMIDTSNENVDAIYIAELVDKIF